VHVTLNVVLKHRSSHVWAAAELWLN